MFFLSFPFTRGAAKSLLELVDKLIKDYNVICSVVLPDYGPLSECLNNIGASVLIIDYGHWFNSSSLQEEEIHYLFYRSVKNLFMKMKIFVEINPDMVFTETMCIPWGAIVASVLNKPHIWYIHEFGMPDHSWEFYIPFQTILDFIKTSSNLIFVNSNALKNSLFGLHSADNIMTIYPFMDIPDKNLYKIEQNYFKKRKSIKLIITGVIIETKGQEDAILAVRELINRKKDIELIVMGKSTPHYLNKLEKIVKDNNLGECVSFFDFQKNPFSAVNSADIVLVCSKYETFGYVTLEAMLLRKPIVGTNTGGTPELIKEGFNGLLYEPGDYKELANKIEYLIDHKDKIKEFGDNGYKFAKENFTKERNGEKVYELLKNLKNKENSSSSPFNQFVFYLVNTAIQDKELESIKRTKSYKLYILIDTIISKIILFFKNL